MQVLYVEHGNMELLMREVNEHLSGGTWRLKGPINYLSGRWVQMLVKGE